MKNNVKKQIEGITLVALVVTIIVLLILAGVAINLSLGDDGIFRKAMEGSKIYENASNNEQIQLEEISNHIDDYLNENGEKLSEVEEAIKEGTVFKENTTIKDEFGNSIKIPTGFKLAGDSGKTVIEGIVIEDVEAGDQASKGNQYVWIPLGKVYINENKDSKEN